MATTRIWAVRSRLDHMVDYVSNKEKLLLIMQRMIKRYLKRNM